MWCHNIISWRYYIAVTKTLLPLIEVIFLVMCVCYSVCSHRTVPIHGCARFPEILQDFSERQILWSLCSVDFHALTLNLPIHTSLSVSPKLQVSLSSTENCSNFTKTRTPQVPALHPTHITSLNRYPFGAPRHIFFFKILLDTCPFLGTLKPCVWSPLGFKARVGSALFKLCWGVHDIHSLRFTSGGNTSAGVYGQQSSWSLFPHACFSRGRMPNLNHRPPAGSQTRYQLGNSDSKCSNLFKPVHCVGDTVGKWAAVLRKKCLLVTACFW